MATYALENKLEIALKINLGKVYFPVNYVKELNVIKMPTIKTIVY